MHMAQPLQATQHRKTEPGLASADAEARGTTLAASGTALGKSPKDL